MPFTKKMFGHNWITFPFHPTASMDKQMPTLDTSKSSSQAKLRS